MRLIKMKTPAALLVLSALSSYAASAHADVWVFEPLLSLDQRLDDNFYLDPAAPGSLSATRGVGELGVSREGPAYSIKGLARIDALLVSNTDVSEEGIDSNGILIFDATRLTRRSRYNFLTNLTFDTPSRDIEADISDEASVGTNTGLLVAQSLLTNVARQDLTIEPSFEYDVSRRLEFNTALTINIVEHDLPTPSEVIFDRYLALDEPLGPLPFGSSEVRDAVGVFTPTGELDDFRDVELSMGFRYKLSPVSTLITSASYSRFDSDNTVDAAATTGSNEGDRPISIPFRLLDDDENDRNIFRNPRASFASTTARLNIGIERLLTPTLQLSVGGGIYTSTAGFTGLLSTSTTSDGLELTAEEIDTVERINSVLSNSDETTEGFLANIGLTYDAGLTRYQGRFAVDVQPSSAGAQVETNQLIGEIQRSLSPRLEFSLYASAFEPDRLGAMPDNEFSRRFISFQPRIEWQYTRSWTVTAAYRYRRQRTRLDTISAESNAVLFAIEYSPPSKLRDAAAASGL